MAGKNMQASGSQPNANQQNAMARSLILSNAVDRFQVVYASSVNAANQTVVNIAPRNVGLIKGFWVDISAPVTNSAGGTATLTQFGAANILSQIVFTDLQNNTRIQTAGWHLHMINSIRSGKPFLGCDTLSGSYPIAYGSNYPVISAPSTIAASGTGTVTMRYYIPLAYSQSDLRGAVYANVVNATMNLQLTLNSAAFVASGDATQAVYSGSAGSLGNVSITVYQHYLDQLPVQNNNTILPYMDLSTIYELKNTSMSGLQANQDFPIPYANFRSFLSTSVIYDNGGTLNPGSDVNYWTLQSANYTQLFKMSPIEAAALTRLKLGNDYPSGAYYFNHRNRPINTIQYGNMELIVNASTVNANAQLLVGYEDFAMVNYVTGAGSLPGGGA
jgi:hypothetical protein